MENPIRLRYPWQARDGEVIVLHPIRAVAVRWTIVGRRRVDDTHTGLDYETDDGGEGLIVLDEDQLIVVRAEEAKA
jgi:hypothetical protein